MIWEFERFQFERNRSLFLKNQESVGCGGSGGGGKTIDNMLVEDVQTSVERVFVRRTGDVVMMTPVGRIRK